MMNLSSGGGKDAWGRPVPALIYVTFDHEAPQYLGTCAASPSIQYDEDRHAMVNAVLDRFVPTVWAQCRAILDAVMPHCQPIGDQTVVMDIKKIVQCGFRLQIVPWGQKSKRRGHTNVMVITFPHTLLIGGDEDDGLLRRRVSFACVNAEKGVEHG